MFPAARVADAHICPQVTGVPHVGGPILPSGAALVLIGGMPAARISDLASCTGPPDVIATGAPGVFFMGLPAARMMDNTLHGGLIVQGCPTVLIGNTGGSGPPSFGPGIILEGTPAEQAILAALLDRIRNSGPDGAALIHRLETAATPTRFHIGTSITDASGRTFPLSNLGGGGTVRPANSLSGDNEVYIDPTHLITYNGTDGNTYRETPEGLLAHEAGHADLNNAGHPSHATTGPAAEAAVRDLTNPIREDMGMVPEA